MTGTPVEINALVLEYVSAVNELHTTHSSTDVHNHGGIAGQAITDHCAWQCHVLDARLNPRTMTVEGEFVSVHAGVKERYAAAERALLAAVGVPGTQR
jgi:hypothetical protein